MQIIKIAFIVFMLYSLYKAKKGKHKFMHDIHCNKYSSILQLKIRRKAFFQVEEKKIIEISEKNNRIMQQ